MAISLRPDRDNGPAVERRAAQRYLVQHWAQWRSLVDAAGAPGIATVNDISADGIGLVLEHWVAPGSTLFVTLLDANGDPGMFNVVRVTRSVRHGRASWSVGGTFVQKISAEDLQSVLKPPSLVGPQTPPTESPVREERELARVQRPSVVVTLRHGLPTGTAACQTSSRNPAGPHISASTPTRLPEARKRQILEQIRASIKHSKGAAESTPKAHG